MAPLIGITGRAAHDLAWCPPLLGARQGYVNAIAQAGGIPVVLPPLADPAVVRGMLDGLQGVLLTGGVDVDPGEYGETPHPKLGQVQRERDLSELPLARWAVAEGKPVLGICRGHQVLNVALGGSLYQDIPAQIDGSLDHEASIRHECWNNLDHGLTLDPDSLLAELLGASYVEVNSLHHQGIKDLAPGLRIVGRAPDGVVEAVEGTGEGFVLGVQCHPEELWQEVDVRWRNVFRAFVVAASQPVGLALHG
jgi:putative glutamine amidotransferase